MSMVPKVFDTLEKRSQIQQQDESITDPSSKIAVTEGGESSSSMYYTGYQSRGSSSEDRDNGSNPAVGQYHPQQQQGFVRYGTEVPPVYPGMNNLWNPQPVVNPYQYGCFPYNNVFGSGTVEPNPKQKTEDFWNSHNPQQMENVYDHAPDSTRSNSRVDRYVSENGRRDAWSGRHPYDQAQSLHRREREGGSMGRDRFSGRYDDRYDDSQNNGTAKWEHDLFDQANRSPSPKSAEDQIAKVEALLAS